MTENEVFEGIHKDCGSLEICNYKETGCGDCLIRQTLIKAEEALEKVQQFEAIGTIEEFKALKEKNTEKKPIKKLGACYSLAKDGTKEHEIIQVCPNCHSIALKYSYPCRCGQVIDWSE